ncbi:Uncharacterized protein APZ42_004287 [Daphnia magna]|uniref:Uncharacterized protein n=1 Tax=Daphnia magna TaxID=35525 RepID=A0A164H5P5_9CRUS|nr:Uncharacterized protein APZ42_004287 [Daphnia magna]
MVAKQPKTIKFGWTISGRVTGTIHFARTRHIKSSNHGDKQSVASGSVEPTPLIVPQEVSEALTNWFTKGVSTDESKAKTKRTLLTRIRR